MTKFMVRLLCCFIPRQKWRHAVRGRLSLSPPPPRRETSVWMAELALKIDNINKDIADCKARILANKNDITKIFDYNDIATLNDAFICFDKLTKDLGYINSLRILYKGFNSIVYLMNKNIKVKITWNATKEFQLLEKFANMKTSKTPRVLKYFKLPDGKDCLVTEYISGNVIKDNKLWNNALLKNLAEYLQELQQYKNIDCPVITSQANYDNFMNLLNQYGDAFENEKNTLKQLADMYLKMYINEPRVLVHADLHGLNVITDDKRSQIISVIDIGGCQYNDAISDLKLFNWTQVVHLSKLLGYKQDDKLKIGYFFHVALRKLQEIAVNNLLPEEKKHSIEYICKCFNEVK